MTTTAGVQPTWDLFRDSGEPRTAVSRRSETIMTAVSLWFVLGLFLDAYAHANFSNLETFFTPWHAVFYSGFAATGGWVLWTIRGRLAEGRRGLAAVPVGYGPTVVALPVFAVSGAADLTWHSLLGIETNTDIFFSPSHLGLITSMIVILTTPLRAAWADADRRSPGLPAVLTLAFAASLVLLFLTYGNALLFSPKGIVMSYSNPDDSNADMLAARIAVTNLVLLAPLLLLARRWRFPRGAATIGYATAALISCTLTGFARLDIPLGVVAAGIGVDLLAHYLRPAADRRGAFWGFAAAAGFLTWTVYFGVAVASYGQFPAAAALWTGTPIVAALLGWLLAVLMLPNAHPADERVPAVSS